jgi:hypothetical protein
VHNYVLNPGSVYENQFALIKYLFLALGAFFVWLSVKDIDNESWKNKICSCIVQMVNIQLS